MNISRSALAVLILLVGALSSACSSLQPAPSQKVEDNHIERALEASVVLYSTRLSLVCAGTRVSPTRVLTAYHCAVASVIPYEELVKMELSGKDIMSISPERLDKGPVVYSTYQQVLENNDEPRGQFGHFIKFDRGHDLALFETAISTQPTAVIDASELAVGQEIWAIGHPSGMVFTYSHGYVATPCRKDEGLPGFDPTQCWTQVDMTIHGGSSGGGLYNMRGSLIGVASWMYDEGQGFYSAPQYVSKFVDG